MNKVLKPFKKNLKTENLELRPITPTKETAEKFWDIIKKEMPDDYKYIGFAPSYMEKPLPNSAEETLSTLIRECGMKNSVNYAVYHNDNLIGFAKIIYWQEVKILEIGELWFIKSARGKGFATEINKKMEELAFLNKNILQMGWQCFEPNDASKYSALNNGYELRMKKPDSIRPDLIRLVFTKTI